MSLTPVGNRALVRLDPSETTTSTGLVIPDQAQEKSKTGTVLAVGPGRLHPRLLDHLTVAEQGVEVGDRVLLNSAYAGAWSSEDGEVIVDLDEVLAVLS